MNAETAVAATRSSRSWRAMVGETCGGERGDSRRGLGGDGRRLGPARGRRRRLAGVVSSWQRLTSNATRRPREIALTLAHLLVHCCPTVFCCSRAQRCAACRSCRKVRFADLAAYKDTSLLSARICALLAAHSCLNGTHRALLLSAIPLGTFGFSWGTLDHM